MILKTIISLIIKEIQKKWNDFSLIKLAKLERNDTAW
jgi:hypothetical protein